MTKYVLLLLLYSLSFRANAREIRVGKHGPYHQIQSALNAAAAGDTIIVEAGLYKEGNLSVTKPVYLRGEGLPTLDGQFTHEVLSIRSDHVTVSGFRIQHSGRASMEEPGGIKIYNGREVCITNNILYDNYFGIYVQYGTRCEIRDNEITAFGKDEQQSGNGIHCWKSDSLIISGNKISGHRDGIYFEFVRHSVIWRNISTQNVRYGLHFMFSNSDSYISNVFRNNGAGVAVMFTSDVKMFNNEFSGNWGDASYGLLLKEISDAWVYNNRFFQNTAGVFMEGTNRIDFQHNQFHENGWALRIQASCMSNTFSANNFSGNTFDVSTNGSLVLNEFNGNYWERNEGYDLNRDGISDTPYRPLSLFSVIAERNSSAMLLFRSFMVTLLDRSEKVMPSITPENFMDEKPLMHPLPL